MNATEPLMPWVNPGSIAGPCMTAGTHALTAPRASAENRTRSRAAPARRSRHRGLQSDTACVKRRRSPNAVEKQSARYRPYPLGQESEHSVASGDVHRFREEGIVTRSAFDSPATAALVAGVLLVLSMTAG